MSIPASPQGPETAPQSRRYLLTPFAYDFPSPAHNNGMRTLHPFNLQASKPAPRALIFSPAEKTQNTYFSHNFPNQALSPQQLDSDFHQLQKKSEMCFLRVRNFVNYIQINMLASQPMYQLINTRLEKMRIFASKTAPFCPKTPISGNCRPRKCQPGFAPPRPPGIRPLLATSQALPAPQH